MTTHDHVVTCFIPDEATGTLPVFEGMAAVFDVGPVGTSAASRVR